MKNEKFIKAIQQKFNELSSTEKQIITIVWTQKETFIHWPTESRLLIPGCIRPKKEKHDYSDAIKEEATNRGIKLDHRSNGPAIAAYLFTGGLRPARANGTNEQWHIHHIYNGLFPYREEEEALHAVKDGNLFTQSAGLVAIHPIANALAHEYFYFAWLLRYEAYKRFRYDPESIFCEFD